MLSSTGRGELRAMLPNPAIGQANTPDSLVDKENEKLSQSATLHAKVPLTEPRPRHPLQSRDTNRVTPNNATQSGVKSVSAPDFIKKTAPVNILSALDDNEGVKKTVKRPKTEPANENATAWIYGSEVDGIITKLELADIPDTITSPLSLFKLLETEGRLSPAVLKLYSRCPDLQSIMMGPSYGGKVNEIGLVTAGHYPAFNCTVPLFHGFKDLLVLDLTCVSIEDEEVRYLIKLDRIQALGLSGTRISGKSLRYLAKHAKFARSLKCIKLCYLDKLEDSAILELFRLFPSLSEIDLYGSNKITLSAVVEAVPCDPVKFRRLRKVRLPEKSFALLQERHVVYSELNRKHDLASDPESVSSLPSAQVQSNLRLYRKLFPDIFLNLNVDSLEEKLRDILSKRRKEEFLWSICQ
ncbi:hypothetical protein PSACC_02997 [Paramicrosporidium saccamoebae]|uniref:Uncharacterized protein n=1 Tax=Paramicrosporidium saccamoebae TaxID=1246581 RepID=A0A2H9THU9_9FUNG|nr:hypothetical protein PSACC_02997 [Paramicrosporidium saccamoebae]